MSIQLAVKPRISRLQAAFDIALAANDWFEGARRSSLTGLWRSAFGPLAQVPAVRFSGGFHREADMQA